MRLESTVVAPPWALVGQPIARFEFGIGRKLSDECLKKRKKMFFVANNWNDMLFLSFLF